MNSIYILITHDQRVEDYASCIYVGLDTWAVPGDCEELLVDRNIEFEIKEIK